jgi:hypothetical protein
MPIALAVALLVITHIAPVEPSSDGLVYRAFGVDRCEASPASQPASTQPAASLLGTWTWTEAKRSVLTLRLTKVEGEKVQGTFDSGPSFGRNPDGSRPVANPVSITDGTFREGRLSFVVILGSRRVEFHAALKGDTLSGTYVTRRGNVPHPTAFDAKRVEHAANTKSK